MQYINLYKHLAKHEAPAPNAKHIGLAGGAAVALVLLIYIVALVRLHGNDSEKEFLAQQNGAVLSELKQLKIQHNSIVNDPAIRQKTDTMREQLRRKNALLKAVRQQPAVKQAGFSVYLEGLAAQHLRGLWLKEISLSGAGQRLALAGNTRKPEYLPQYLQRLAKEPVFKGQQFAVLRLNQEEQHKDLLQFEVRSRAEVK